MESYREIKNILTWHDEGKFEVELVNGVITKLNFCEPGNGPDNQQKSLTSTNFKFLQAVQTNLTELLNFMEKENERMGYRYGNGIEAKEVELTTKLEKVV
jgi:hypothetical protein